jgi:hypothetical protein
MKQKGAVLTAPALTLKRVNKNLHVKSVCRSNSHVTREERDS